MSNCLLCLLWAFFMLWCPLSSTAESETPFTLQELLTWADGISQEMQSWTPENEPSGEAFWREEGYVYVYPQATLTMTTDHPEAHTRLASIRITSPDLQGPRGIRIGDERETLLRIFPQIPPEADDALLFLQGTYPQAMRFGTYHRTPDGCETFQYALHEPLGNGMFSDAGLLIRLQDARVCAMEIYGLERHILSSDVLATWHILQSLSGEAQQAQTIMDPSNI